MYRLEIFKSKGKQPWYSRIVSAQNGQVIWSSEGYATKGSCAKTAKNFYQAMHKPHNWKLDFKVI